MVSYLLFCAFILLLGELCRMTTVDNYRDGYLLPLTAFLVFLMFCMIIDETKRKAEVVMDNQLLEDSAGE